MGGHLRDDKSAFAGGVVAYGLRHGGRIEKALSDEVAAEAGDETRFGVAAKFLGDGIAPIRATVIRYRVIGGHGLSPCCESWIDKETDSVKHLFQKRNG
jgi:hypothetical protein